MKVISVVVLSAIYTMIFFNGFYYLTLANLGIHIDVNTDLMVKGFFIGLTGIFFSEKLNVRFIPFGWIGSLLGLQAVDFIFTLATPFESFYKEGLRYAVALNSKFLLMVIAGSVVYYAVKALARVFYSKLNDYLRY